MLHQVLAIWTSTTGIWGREGGRNDFFFCIFWIFFFPARPTKRLTSALMWRCKVIPPLRPKWKLNVVNWLDSSNYLFCHTPAISLVVVTTVDLKLLFHSQTCSGTALHLSLWLNSWWEFCPYLRCAGESLVRPPCQSFSDWTSHICHTHTHVTLKQPT